MTADGPVASNASTATASLSNDGGENKLEKLNLTDDELSRISDAMKNPEFMSLLRDYMDELKDNREVYEQEIAALESERGNEITWIRPSPAEFVVKTRQLMSKMKTAEPIAELKVFINMCHSPEIAVPSMQLIDGRQFWSLPYSLSKAREDFDKAGKRCLVYDCVFNPDSFEKARQRPAFKQLLVQTAIEGIEKQFQCGLDKKYSIPKMKSKGEPVATVLRKPAAAAAKNTDSTASEELKDGLDEKTISLLQQFEQMKMNPEKAAETLPPAPPPRPSAATKAAAKLIEELSDNSERQEGEENGYDDAETPPIGIQTPRYQIVHRGEFDMSNYLNDRSQLPPSMPKELVVRIEVPRCQSMSTMQLDTSEHRLTFVVPEIYDLAIDLPVAVDSSRGSAKFDKSSGRLTIVLPVIFAVAKPE